MNIVIFTDIYEPEVNGVTHYINIFREYIDSIDDHSLLIVAPYSIKKYKNRPSRRDVVWLPACVGLLYSNHYLSFYLPALMSKKIAQFEPDVLLCVTHGSVSLLAEYIAKKRGYKLVYAHLTDILEYTKYYPVPLVLLKVGSVTLPYFTKISISRSLGLLSSKTNQQFCAKLLKLIYANDQSIITVSNKSKLQLSKIIKNNNIKVVECGISDIDVDKLTMKKWHEFQKFTNHRKIIVVAGRLCLEKRPDLAITVLQKILEKRDDIILVFAGDGPLKKSLTDKYYNLVSEQKIFFLGNLSHRDLWGLFRVADLHLFLSTSDTQGHVINIAGLNQTPTIWCEKGSINSVLVNNQTGYYSDLNADSIADKVLKLLQDHPTLLRFGLEAQKLSSNCNQSTQSKLLLSTLASFVKS